MTRFIHIADVHLGAKFTYLEGDRQVERCEDLFDSFSRAVDFAVSPDNNIDGVIIAGDLFDVANPDPALVRKVQKEFKKLQDGGKITVLTPGTHDPSIYPESVYYKYQFPGIIMLNSPNPDNPVVKAINNVDFYFYGMEYHPIHSRLPLEPFRQKGGSGFHIALLHCSFAPSAHWEVDSSYLPVEREFFEKSDMDYFALGHYHNFAQFQFGKTTAVYPGTLEGRSFHEQGQRFLVTVNFIGPGRIEVEKIPWNRKTMTTLELDVGKYGFQTNQEIIRAISEKTRDGSNLLLKVRLTGISDFIADVSLIKESLEQDYFYISVEDELSYLEPSKMEVLARENSIRGLFVRKLLVKMHGADERERAVLQNAMKTVMAHMKGGEQVAV